MINLEGVSKIFYANKSRGSSYGIDDLNKVRRERIFALKDVDLKLTEPEFIVVTGPNGSGKTTLLRLLARQIKPSRGLVRIKRAPDAFINPLQGLSLNLSVDNFLLRNSCSNSLKNKILEFAKLEEQIAKNIPIDDYVRALPAGKSKIIKVEYGDATVLPL